MTTGIQHTASVALYLRQLLVAELEGGVVPPMPDWSLDCLEELHFAVKVIKQAVQNKSTCKLIDNISNLMDKELLGQLKWSVIDYVEALSAMGTRCTGTQEHVEGRLRELFPPAEAEIMTSPTVIVDSEGIILVWFLPGLMSMNRQVSGKVHVEFTN